jgi:hypothetical protein
MEQIKTEEPPKPRSVDGRIPRDLETIVLKAIEKEPGSRYQTAEAMGEDLRRFLDDEPIRARRVGAAERFGRWARRNPWIATLGGALTAVLVIATVSSLLAMERFRTQAETQRTLATAREAARQRADRANEDLREAVRQKEAANAALAEASGRVQARFDLAREAIRSFKAGVEEEEALKEDRLRPLRDKLLGSARRFYDRLGELLRG